MSLEDRLRDAQRRLELRAAFGARLKLLRLDAGLSVEQLDKRSRVPAGTVYRCERGEVDPRLSQLVALAEGLGVPPVDLTRDGRAR